MKQVQRLVTLALALFLIGLPAVTMAQSSPTSPAAPAAPAGQDKPTSPALDKPAPPSASPSTSPSTTSPSGRVGSPSATPMSAADCQNNGWQKFGLKSEAECTAKVKK